MAISIDGSLANAGDVFPDTRKLTVIHKVLHATEGDFVREWGIVELSLRWNLSDSPPIPLAAYLAALPGSIEVENFGVS
jgi:hypothetical protein